jgi:hypothetical protein
MLTGWIGPRLTAGRLLACVILLSDLALSQSSAKDSYKRGESELRQNRITEAYASFALAAGAEPGNKKYHSKLVQVGRIASKVVEEKATAQLETDPKSAEVWLTSALMYDPANASAVGELANLNGKIGSANETARKAMQAADAGDLSLARKLVDSVSLYRDFIPTYPQLSKDHRDRLGKHSSFWLGVGETRFSA